MLVKKPTLGAIGGLVRQCERSASLELLCEIVCFTRFRWPVMMANLPLHRTGGQAASGTQNEPNVP